MRAIVKIAPGIVPGLVSVIACFGCQPAGSSGPPGLVLTPPPGWQRVEARSRMVPGVALSAWAGPEGSSLEVYRDLPIPGGSASMLAEALANRLQNLPGLSVREKRTEAIAGTTVARVEVVAQGTGDSLAPSGVGTPTAPAGKSLIPTRQLTIGIIRDDATYYLRWHSPDSSYDRIAPNIRATLQSLRLESH